MAVDPLTYPGLIGVARLLQIRLLPCSGDSDGMFPDALRDLCRHEKVAAVYVMPTVHSPLGAVMSLERRVALVAVAREHDLVILEDDAYGFLEAQAPPSFGHLAAELAFYIYSLSKPIAPGIRTAFLHVPRRFLEAAGDALRLTTSGAVPLFGPIVARWLGDGTVAAWLQMKRDEGKQRQELAHRLLSGLSMMGHPTSYHLWLLLPDHRNAGDVVRMLAARNVSVSPARAFAANSSEEPNAIRLSLGGEANIDRLASGLSAVASVVA
jgi:DNA-binding transcriptional MocR family regulator